MKDVNTSNKINIEDIKDKIDGEIPEGGYIIINEAGDAIFELEFKDKTYVKLFTGEIVEEPKNADKYYIKVETTTNSETEPFLGGPIRKEEIEKVITVPTNKVPSDVIGSFDVTDTTNQSETGKVMVWYYDKDSNGLYEVYIGQVGRVKANPDSTKLFNYLINVKEIDLTYLDTSNVTSMFVMFQRCENLEKIIGLENFDTSNVTDMTGMFNKCYKLQTINLSSFDTSRVANMSYMFTGCSDLTELKLSSKFITSSVTDMQSMFQDCENLAQLDVSRFDTSKVTDVNAMFQNCISLKEIDVSGFDTSAVTNMKWMFQGCSNLTSLDLRSFDTSQVTDMTNMFKETTNLKPIYIGEKWKTASASTNMFSGSKTTSVEELCEPGSTESWCVVTG